MPVQGPTTNHVEIRGWAQKHHAVPVELLPHQVDHAPPEIRLMLPEMIQRMPDVRPISWEEFFTYFDTLGLTFVYDADHTGYNEILQIDAENPYKFRGGDPISPEN